MSDVRRLTVVVPVFNEEESLPELHRRIRESEASLGGPLQIVYVNDGSEDGSRELLAGWARGEEGVVLVDLARNFGLEVAMSAGLDHAEGEYVVLLHADLQDPPELIPEMVALADQEGADVVYARRIGRDEGRVKRTLATGFYGLMRRLAQVPYQGQAGDFRLMSRRVVDAVRAMPERRRFLRGMVAWVGLKQVPIEYRRAGRLAGRGASYPQLLKLASEAVTSFSTVPLNLAAYVGLITAMLSAAAALIVLSLTVAGAIATRIEVWVLISVLFLGGVQLITIGILGRYLARVHDEALRRPLYVVNEVISHRSEE
jgi:polyisoprenyl-phosphate glycosyltransferase